MVPLSYNITADPLDALPGGTVHHSDCSDILTALESDSIDGVCTDPPYHLRSMSNLSGAPKTRQEGPHQRLTKGFMNQQWDGGDIAFRRDVWLECFRVLKPGAYMTVFGAPRTCHSLASAIEDSGFEIHDMIIWLYGSGFPKSKNISRAIENHLAYANTRCAIRMVSTHQPGEHGVESLSIPAGPYVAKSPEAVAWEGWGSALKPAYEPILLCRKPLIGTLAENVLMHGVGGINIDASRVRAPDVNALAANRDRAMTTDMRGVPCTSQGSPLGRWPANVLHDGSDEVMDAFAIFGNHPSCKSPSKARPEGSIFRGRRCQGNLPMDDGGIARFFYCAKANKKDRCGSMHPTVKPLALMRYLLKLIIPPNGTVLDPFAGSGTTGQAAVELGFNPILIEREAEYIADIVRRMSLVAERRSICTY
jgi:DNA modification methylase